MSDIEDRIKFSILSNPKLIVFQEAIGQRNFLASTALPIDGDWDTLQRWEIVRGAPIDDLFCICTLSEGWRKEAMEDPRGSLLIDSRGLIRADIFYKASSHDRKANLNIFKRFSILNVRKEEEDLIYCQHSCVQDNALRRCVFVGNPVLVGLHNRGLVAVRDGTVYSMQSSFLGRSALRVAKRANASDVTLLTRKEFFRDWHNIEKREYPFMKAVEEFGNLECQDFLGSLPKDDSIWGSEFDFPELTL